MNHRAWETPDLERIGHTADAESGNTDLVSENGSSNPSGPV